MESFKREILAVGREYDLDLSLLMHLKFLDRVHDAFYEEYDLKGTADIKPVILKCLKTVFIPTDTALLQILFMGKTFKDKRELSKTYEGSKCKNYGLNFSNDIQFSIDQSH